MRVTRAVLSKALLDAARFNQLPLKFIPPSAEWIIRDGDKFTPVACYGYGMLPLLDELGTDGQFRFIVEVL